eukprot:g16469.t1
MPGNKKKNKGGNKAKNAPARSNAANKDDLAGLDEILSNPEQMAAAQREAAEASGFKPRSGKQNAQIGLRGFTQATQNPSMFTDAMSMLGDPSAVKEAEAMMNDPEFKSEINQYMETLKNNSAFRDAMAEAQRKYQALLADPEKMKEATDKYNAMMKQQQDAAAAAAAAAAGKTGEGAAGAAGAAAAAVTKPESDSLEAKDPPVPEAGAEDATAAAAAPAATGADAAKEDAAGAGAGEAASTASTAEATTSEVVSEAGDVPGKDAAAASSCRVADDRSIREGLVHAMSTLQNRGSLAEQLLEEDQDRHGQALQCSLFSSLAIGGLLLGYPVEDVSRYLQSARLCRERMRGLADQSAVSALILYANAHVFVGTRESWAAYREGMNDAEALSQVLLDEDPFVTSFTEYRRHMDNVQLLTKRVVSSGNPIKSLGQLMDTSRMGVKTEEGRRVRARIDKGRVVMSNRRGDRRGAHPAHVVEDCLFLTIRYFNAVEGKNSGLGHVHDYLAAELQRLMQVEAGGVVLATLAGALLGVKSRLARADGLLPVAELVLSLFSELPGLARYDTRLAAHRALAVFKLLANRQLYDALRNIVVAGSEEYTPTFDEYHSGLPICGIEFVACQAEDILRLASPGGGMGTRDA